MMINRFITPEILLEMSCIKSKIVEKILYEKSYKRTLDINLMSLPHDIHDKIVEHYKKILPSKYALRDWIPKEKLNWYKLSSNPCAVEILMEKANHEDSLKWMEYEALKKEDKICWKKLCKNEESTKILKKYPSNILWDYLSINSKNQAVDMIKERIEYEKVNVLDFYEDNRLSIHCFCNNTSPEIMNFLKERIEYEKRLSKNEYKYLDIADKIDWHFLSRNPGAIDLLRENPKKIIWIELSSNENPRAIDLLRERAIIEKNMGKKKYEKLTNKISWEMLSLNPNAIHLLKDRVEYEKGLKPEDYDNLVCGDTIEWIYLSRNPGAIEILNENFDNIHWNTLSINPNAIEILKATPEKIDWSYLSRNPGAIELLKANPEKIWWNMLSENENAIEIIKERIEYEKSLTSEKYNTLKCNKKINWSLLSKNKSIFVAI